LLWAYAVDLCHMMTQSASTAEAHLLGYSLDRQVGLFQERLGAADSQTDDPGLRGGPV